MVTDMRTLDDPLNISLSNERMLSFLPVGFALLASLLAIVGLYGALAFVVARRTREPGIRTPLGAERGRIIRLVMREMLALILLGIAAGPAVFIASTATLLIVALSAAFIPAWRASRIDPLGALRCE